MMGNIQSCSYYCEGDCYECTPMRYSYHDFRTRTPEQEKKTRILIAKIEKEIKQNARKWFKKYKKFLIS
jgi:predicted nucleic acid-binding OB-fold protein